MKGERITLDTNILVYAIDRNADRRHELAASLVDAATETDCVLTLQVLSEFFAATTKKNKMPTTEAAAQIRDWQTLFPIALPNSRSLNQAMAAVMEHSLSLWEASLWSVAKDAEVTLLLSEDFQHGRELGGVKFLNPFLDGKIPW